MTFMGKKKKTFSSMTTLFSQTTLVSNCCGLKGDQNYDIEGKLSRRRPLALHAHGRQYYPPSC